MVLKNIPSHRRGQRTQRIIKTQRPLCLCGELFSDQSCLVVLKVCPAARGLNMLPAQNLGTL